MPLSAVKLAMLGDSDPKRPIPVRFLETMKIKETILSNSKRNAYTEHTTIHLD